MVGFSVTLKVPSRCTISFRGFRIFIFDIGAVEFTLVVSLLFFGAIVVTDVVDASVVVVDIVVVVDMVVVVDVLENCLLYFTNSSTSGSHIRNV